MVTRQGDELSAHPRALEEKHKRVLGLEDEVAGLRNEAAELRRRDASAPPADDGQEEVGARHLAGTGLDRRQAASQSSPRASRALCTSMATAG